MFPSELIKTHNPLYEYERRQIRWLSTQHQIRRNTIVFVVIVLVLSLLLMMIVDGRYLYFVRRGRSFVSIFATLPNAAGVIGTIVNFYYMFVAMRSVNNDVNSGLWDGLRLTFIGEDNLVWAKYAIAQAKVWPFMLLYIALQILVVMVGTPFGNPFFRSAYGLTPDLTLLFTVTRIIMLVLAVLEPIWIMRALTAVALAIGLRVRSQVAGVAGIFLTVVCVEMSQVGISRLLNTFTRYAAFGYGRFTNISDRFVLQLLVAILSLLISFMLYRVVRQIGLRNAFRAAHTSDE